jgi:putative nucleotidyltransferase with HDIG domain
MYNKKMLTRNQAIEILNNHLKNKNLFRHCLAVEAAMKGLARYFNENEEKWGLVGLLHDGDWEETRNNPKEHTLKLLEWIKEKGENDQEVINTILSHNFENNNFRQPKTKMEWALYTCDDLTGLIVAVALITPEKKLSSVSVKSILKKFSSPSFAAGVNRNQIKLCEEKLGIKLEKFVEIVLMSMLSISKELGL